MKKLLVSLILTIALSVSASAGCVMMIQNTDVDPNYPSCIKHIDTWRCDGQFIIVTWFECF